MHFLSFWERAVVSQAHCARIYLRFRRSALFIMMNRWIADSGAKSKAKVKSKNESGATPRVTRGYRGLPGVTRGYQEATVYAPPGVSVSSNGFKTTREMRLAHVGLGDSPYWAKRLGPRARRRKNRDESQCGRILRNNRGRKFLGVRVFDCWTGNPPARDGAWCLISWSAHLMDPAAPV